MLEPRSASGLFTASRSNTEVSFEKLMPHRVRNILVVASPYDAFVIEEGGRLTELILNEYVRLNLSDGPRVTRVASAEEALEVIEHQHFDLIITMARVGSMDGMHFGVKVKEIDASVCAARALPAASITCCCGRGTHASSSR